MLDESKESSVTRASAPKDEITGALEAAIADVESASREWGIRTNHPEGRFISVFLAALRALGKLVSRTVLEMKEILRRTQTAADAEIARLHEANVTATLAIVQAEAAQRTLIAGVCKDVASQITSDTARWLVLAEQNISVKQRRWYAVKMTVATLVVIGVSFWVGYGLRSWEDEPAVQSLARCVKAPVKVIAAGGNPTGEWVCRMDTLVPRTWGDLGSEMQRRWLWLWRYGRGG